MQCRLLRDVDHDSADRSIGDGGVVPAGTHSVVADFPEPAVHPGHRGGVDAVPSPDMECPATPGALSDEVGSMARLRSHNRSNLPKFR